MLRKTLPPDNPDAEIARLRNELYFARHALISLMPDQAREILEAIIFCDSFEALGRWERWAVSELIALTLASAARESLGLENAAEALCPLCQSGASPSGEGFSVPIGLTRHLQGTHLTYPCPVYKAALDDQLDALRQQDEQGPQGPRPLFARAAPWDVPEPLNPGAQAFPNE